MYLLYEKQQVKRTDKIFVRLNYFIKLEIYWYQVMDNILSYWNNTKTTKMLKSCIYVFNV